MAKVNVTADGETKKATAPTPESAIAALPDETKQAIAMLLRQHKDADVPEASAVVVDTAGGGNRGLYVFASKAARRVFAEKKTAPACFHQVTTVMVLDKEISFRSRATYMAGSLLLLLFQLMTLFAVASGISAPSCVDNADCVAGNYCAIDAGATAGFCSACLRNDGFSPRFKDATLNATAHCASVPADDAFCRACYDARLPGDGWNTGKSVKDHLRNATNRMYGGDWVAVILVSFVVGLYCAGELRDIKLCEITFAAHGGADASPWVRRYMFTLLAVRTYAFIPVLVHVAAMLVLHRGSDAISVCFNGVAILFLLDVDVYLFEPVGDFLQSLLFIYSQVTLVWGSSFLRKCALRDRSATGSGCPRSCASASRSSARPRSATSTAGTSAP